MSPSRKQLLVLLLGCLLASMFVSAGTAKIKKHHGCITVQGKKVCAAFIPDNPQPVCNDDVSCGATDTNVDNAPPEDSPVPPPNDQTPPAPAAPVNPPPMEPQAPVVTPPPTTTGAKPSAPTPPATTVQTTTETTTTPTP